jgi:DNA helicase-2/ATP-dependent DNA helicase PcrA
MAPVSLEESLVAGLNPEQRRAVLCGDGPMLVLAGAGSGKTRMLTHRIAYLIASGRAAPHQILAVTFTNKAAQEMRERIGRLLGTALRGHTGALAGVHAPYGGVWVATFHATCVRILRRDIERLGYAKSFVIYDDTDSLAAIKRVLRAMQLPERTHPPRAMRSQIDRAKNRGQTAADIGRSSWAYDAELAEVYRRYQEALTRSNALDFGDLLLQTVRLFEQHPDVLRSYQSRWRYMLVDEYQDTNPIQFRLLQLLAGGGGNLCVVGDEDQSIYRFREADIQNILSFERHFPGAHVFRLEQNYRSTQPILDAALAVVANNTERKGKTLYTSRRDGEPVHFYQGPDDRAEAGFVVAEILRIAQQSVPLSETAIIYRTHAQSRVIEEELLKYNLPYVVVGGTRFYDRAEIKDALAYMRVIRNPDDTESLVRIINTPARGIGRATLDAILAHALHAGLSAHAALSASLEQGLLAAAAARRVEQFLAMLSELRDYAHDDGYDQVSMLLERILERSGLLAALESQRTIESEARIENLRELVGAAKEFERQNRESAEVDTATGDDGLRPLVDLFMEQVTLLAGADSLDAGAQRVPLMTAHVAKGLEFDTVFLVGLEEGLLPHYNSLEEPAALEEERRLCYVGMTRARERLYLTNASVRLLYGTTRYNRPSRFLDEIPSRARVAGSRMWGGNGYGGRGALRNGAEEDAPSGRGAPEESAPKGVHVDLSEGQWTDDSPPELRSGTRLHHPTFGSGTVVDQVQTVRGPKLRIRFDHAGMKEILLRFAKLRILE